ncbi:MAG: BTAD domain-containing putative transcriptional regulator, partial [Anaerolineales bacterium]
MLPPTAASRSLLAYLILHHDRVHRRESLAELFWPERPRERCLHNLSTALWHIRHCLAPAKYLLTETQTIQFDSTLDVWLDVEELKSIGEKARHPSISNVERISLSERCIQLYRGDFLEGNYDDWCLEERYALEEFYLNVLNNLVELYENMNQMLEALRCTEILLKHDPLREEWACTAVRLHILLNQRREALRIARHCRAILRHELKTEPSPHTKAIFDQYLGTAWWVEEESDQEFSIPDVRHSYPESLLEHPPFVGREKELSFLIKNWDQARSGNGGLILVGGEAGIGKTRLVTELGDYV